MDAAGSIAAASVSIRGDLHLCARREGAQVRSLPKGNIPCSISVVLFGFSLFSYVFLTSFASVLGTRDEDDGGFTPRPSAANGRMLLTVILYICNNVTEQSDDRVT